MTQHARVIPFPQRHRDGDVWEPFVDERALARHFAVSSRTVRRWRLEGLPSHLFIGSRRFRISEAESWLTERRTG